MEKEIQKTVKKISEHKEIAEISNEESFEFDENELEKYLKQVIKEIKKEPASKQVFEILYFPRHSLWSQ